jgi:uncharacterized protein YPO0396
MKQIRRIKLINWHRFTHHIVNVDGNLLLIGDNASGKSTILDALQVCLVAHMTSVRLNRAANEGGDRDLRTYVRGLVSSGDINAGEARYLRQDATAYVMVEFSEDGTRSARESRTKGNGRPDAPSTFVLGVVIDAFADGRLKKEHFIASGLTFEDLPCLDPQRVTRSVSEFRRCVRETAGVRWYADVDQYQQAVLQRLGRLNPEFFRLFVRALAFQKIDQIRSFVYSYLLDESPEVQVASLRDAVERYRQQHALASEARERIGLLAQLLEKDSQIKKLKADQELYVFLTERAKLGNAFDAGHRAQADLEGADSRVVKAEDNCQTTKRQHETALTTLNRVRADLAAHAQYQEFLNLQHLADTLQAELRTLQEEERKLHNALKLSLTAVAAFQQLTTAETSNARGPISLAQANVNTAARSAIDDTGKLASTVLSGTTPVTDRSTIQDLLASWNATLTELRHGAFRLSQRRTELKDQRDQAAAELEDLRTGKRRYLPSTECLRELLSAELATPPEVLCEVIEVVDEKWQDAVEGYLNTRRFDLLVAPQDYDRALTLYERQKQTERLWGVGLVNTQKTKQLPDRPRPESLAAKITTTSDLARGYITFLLGNVVCCGHEGELKHHQRAITASCMVYQNYAARQIAFDVYQNNWYIGSRGLTSRIAFLETQVVQLSEDLLATETAGSLVDNTVSALERGAKGVELLSEHFDLPNQLQATQTRLVNTQTTLDQLRQGDAGRLQAVVESAESAERDAAEAKNNAVVESQLAKENRKTVQQQVDAAKDQARLLEDELNRHWPIGEDFRDASEQRYQAERQRRQNDDIERVFSSQAKSRETEIQNRHSERVKLRTDYNNRYQFAGNIFAEETTDFADEQQRWVDTKLPEYEEKIASARTDAQHALEEEVIHRLRERLREVKRQFNDLNSALEGLEFSKRSYRFTYRVREDYRRFYEMVMEAGQLENQPLFEASWHREYGSGPLQDLLNEILGERGQREFKDLEQRTDYRAYFDYDIEITDAHGDKSLFSRSAGSGSGGETQTPYYVAMLASMARLYRTRDDSGNRAAIVAFDEPFQKMDERNIAGTIELARRMNLQLFLATPKERCDLILPALGRATCLLVLRDGDDVLLEPFQKNSLAPDGRQDSRPSFTDEESAISTTSGEASEP